MPTGDAPGEDVKDAPRYPPGPPVGWFVLLGLMYWPWVRAIFFPGEGSGEGEGWEFPGSLILMFLGLGYVVFAIVLAILLGRRRLASKAHAVAFHGILGLIGFSILRSV